MNNNDPSFGWPFVNQIPLELKSKIELFIQFGEFGTEHIFSTTDGHVYAFGNNFFGQLGVGHRKPVHIPQIIEELSGLLIFDFSYGLNHVLAKTNEGQLYAWGDNSQGQLGIGANQVIYSPELIDSLSEKFVIDISCGYFHALVLTDENEVYGFGNNMNGQIACGFKYNQWEPKRILGFFNEVVVKVCCGGWHSLALTKSGNVYSWGFNLFGQLGFKDKNNIIFPIKIDINLKFQSIACGIYHSLLLSRCGNIYGIGYNGMGNLGIGNIGYNRSVHHPSPIRTLSKVKEIGSHFRENMSMARLEDDTCYVWGFVQNDTFESLLLGLPVPSQVIETPLLTQFNSLNTVAAMYSQFKMTVKPIEFS